MGHLRRMIREKFIEGGSKDTDGFFPKAPRHPPMDLIGSSSRRIETHNSLMLGLEAFERITHGSTSCKTNIPFLFSRYYQDILQLQIRHVL